MIKIGNGDISKMYVDSTEIVKAYVGNQLVYEVNSWDNPYITDGLIFMLDGIEKGNVEGTWKDLIGGITFTNNNVTSTEYGWSFNGSSSSFYSTTVLTGSENHTVEVCFKPKTTGTYCVFACNNQTANNMMFYKSNSNIVFLQRKNIYSLSLSANTPQSVSLNLNQGLHNGSAKSKSSSTDYWNNSNFWVGRRATGNYFNGEIYAIRFYNRRLTQEEQSHNFNVDNERFELDL